MFAVEKEISYDKTYFDRINHLWFGKGARVEAHQLFRVYYARSQLCVNLIQSVDDAYFIRNVMDTKLVANLLCVHLNMPPRLAEMCANTVRNGGYIDDVSALYGKFFFRTILYFTTATQSNISPGSSIRSNGLSPSSDQTLSPRGLSFTNNGSDQWENYKKLKELYENSRDEGASREQDLIKQAISTNKRMQKDLWFAFQLSQRIESLVMLERRKKV
ncbi:unnamed protein product [Lepeophtheirus salmonis]|uniref:(salmon louse) hypothetical protein n=1 Tax=Lepeophtheirus salmonis TaxID=72036 RepID=A0A7R8H668_LEPSM|nr:unnamed protein product [Lepeophtheirus salmonis]CAF2882322.1 unnamed protein product [Lepeophtheirus salmonis]